MGGLAAETLRFQNVDGGKPTDVTNRQGLPHLNEIKLGQNDREGKYSKSLSVVPTEYSSAFCFSFCSVVMSNSNTSKNINKTLTGETYRDGNSEDLSRGSSTESPIKVQYDIVGKLLFGYFVHLDFWMIGLDIALRATGGPQHFLPVSQGLDYINQSGPTSIHSSPVFSLQPCMHTFCAACYSGWMERSSLCPTCRCPVERICKNHILNNLVEAYLIQHPDKCRSEEDIRSMDARNKITQDMLQPKVRRSFSDEEGSSEDLLDLSDVDSESSDISQPYVLCRQCPGFCRQTVPPLTFPEQEGKTEPGQIPGDSPSTSSNFPTEPLEVENGDE
ncbi:PREDICTED: uncharacterized protein LOC106544012 [Thamnophis sirtalis]|uniref:Uncharacterized protein LOC106544012 n=1 Tax=Thamnophis sirtalis TaxID=35019 RepID=A0A6I9XIM9_9SAUR|nr:PREDICTED: uncharacterized protein LOC106544012 [Thamnophis sirtalis]